MIRIVVAFALSAAVPLVAAQTIQVPPLPYNLTFTPDLSKVSADRRCACPLRPPLVRRVCCA
jgi:hypothetical protein